MTNDFLNVNEIIEYTTLSHKQIRNNLNSLKTSSRFSNLIKGGGKGKGGQLWFHYSLIPHITLRQRRRVKKEHSTKLKVRKLSEYYYSKMTWDYFGCIHPNRDTDIMDLVTSLNDFNSFYVIHRQQEVNHIHFTIQSVLKNEEIKDIFKTYFKTKNISIDKVFLTGFESGFKDDTINYLLRRGRHSSKNDLIDWGVSYNPILI
jgi:hypothetical protein